MARLRGVVVGDLEVRVDRAVAALARDPDALEQVHEELVAHRRAAAAASLAFELAGRIEQEIEALAWVTAEQRVTVDGAGAPARTAGPVGLVGHLRGA